MLCYLINKYFKKLYNVRKGINFFTENDTKLSFNKCNNSVKNAILMIEYTILSSNRLFLFFILNFFN